MGTARKLMLGWPNFHGRKRQTRPWRDLPTLFIRFYHYIVDLILVFYIDRAVMAVLIWPLGPRAQALVPSQAPPTPSNLQSFLSSRYNSSTHSNPMLNRDNVLQIIRSMSIVHLPNNGWSVQFGIQRREQGCCEIGVCTVTEPRF